MNGCYQLEFFGNLTAAGNLVLRLMRQDVKITKVSLTRPF